MRRNGNPGALSSPRYALWAGVAWLFALGFAPPCEAARVRLTWTPGSGDTPAGYLVFTRRAGRAFAKPVDVGPATSAPDGTVSAVVSGLLVGAKYRFAVAAYSPEGDRSALSNELGPGEGGGRGDGDLAVQRAHLRRTRRLVRLSARGLATLPVPAGTDQAGVRVLLLDQSGAPILDEALVPESLRGHGRRRIYQTRIGPGGPSDPQVERLAIAVGPDRVRVHLRVVMPPETSIPPRIGWRMQVGSLALGHDLECATGRPSVRCR